MKHLKPNRPLIRAGVAALSALFAGAAAAAPLPGGTLNPLSVPKYASPMVIPPAMPSSGVDPVTGATLYDIEVVQFQQQILPPPLPATTVWSYGAVGQPATRNYPAFTVETRKDQRVEVNWINNLVDANGNFLPHLLPVDQTLHWANPLKAEPCVDASGNPNPAITRDCRTLNPAPYLGPVPIVTHVHGAHTTPESDGYPEAWYLPNAVNVDCVATYDCTGTVANRYGAGPNTMNGQAHFTYNNDQPSTTLWYHDHTLGMTRLNVYAGPAGFWVIRDPAATHGETGLVSGTLPGPAPQQGDPAGMNYHEIPIVVQDRSFNVDGSLFYPSDRAFFQGFRKAQQLKIPTIGNAAGQPSDISPIWNPEAFFNVMVVNGVSWPFLNVDPQRYRFRLLNGSNSRFLNLAMFVVDHNGKLTPTELPFYLIGGEQSLFPRVVQISTGFATTLPGDGTVPAATPAGDPAEALLMSPAERVDAIVDFSGLAPGTRVRLINTGPDSPFGGFPVVPADPLTTGQVMEFVVGPAPVDGAGNPIPDPSTPPAQLQLTAYDAGFKSLPPIDNAATPRQVSLNEEESAAVCVSMNPAGRMKYLAGVPVSNPLDPVQFAADCALAGGIPFAPKAAVLGTVGAGPVGQPLMWADPITEAPTLGSTEQWDIYNFTVDAHPIHVHLVQFKVLGRQLIAPAPGLAAHGVGPAEAGWEDTVLAYPGEITSVAATFDIEGLYVWHCHIVEHEDNEMMRPFCVVNPDNPAGATANCLAPVSPAI
ncbi:MAG: multicopper oxidase domain-containing protein [Gammaproteobacteria bacterium]|jgi:FtsP/CotA-like multicopper oxidase with cupredoxin domain